MNGCVVYFNAIIKIKPQILESRCTRCVNGECTRRGKISLKPKIICLHDEVSPHKLFSLLLIIISHINNIITIYFLYLHSLIFYQSIVFLTMA